VLPVAFGPCHAGLLPAREFDCAVEASAGYVVRPAT
jgi:hypothetical protein